jgi:hypothetical protein
MSTEINRTKCNRCNTFHFDSELSFGVCGACSTKAKETEDEFNLPTVWPSEYSLKYGETLLITEKSGYPYSKFTVSKETPEREGYNIICFGNVVEIEKTPAESQTLLVCFSRKEAQDFARKYVRDIENEERVQIQSRIQEDELKYQRSLIMLFLLVGVPLLIGVLFYLNSH